jgi:CMP-N,N'-diacetyllegionaminic acid synthase
MIGLIPARRNSKRFPGKNRATFKGLSLLEIAYNSAISSGVIDEVYISTDDPVLINDSIHLGIKAPFMRDQELAQDTTSSWEVVMDFINRTNYIGDLCLLQLTSPMRTANDIKDLKNLYISQDATPALTVQVQLAINDFPQNWCCGCTNLISNKQHCPSSVRVAPNGAAYMIHSSSVSLNSFSTLTGSSALLMPKERSLDIDFQYQLESAEKD